jgi:hypothetical protein
MATLIDTSYFIGPLLIGQSDQATVSTRLTQFIDRYEKEYFLNLMGYNFKKLYDAGIAAVTQKYVDIRDGKEYTNRWGVLDKWRGLKETDPKRSPIANYVYYWFERDTVTVTTGTGEVKPNQQNSRSIYAGNKMMTAWNEMVKWNWEFWNFMYSNQDTYPEFFQDLRNWCNSNDLYKPVYYI